MGKASSIWLDQHEPGIPSTSVQLNTAAPSVPNPTHPTQRPLCVPDHRCPAAYPAALAHAHHTTPSPAQASRPVWVYGSAALIAIVATAAYFSEPTAALQAHGAARTRRVPRAGNLVGTTSFALPLPSTVCRPGFLFLFPHRPYLVQDRAGTCLPAAARRGGRARRSARC